MCIEHSHWKEVQDLRNFWCRICVKNKTKKKQHSGDPTRVISAREKKRQLREQQQGNLEKPTVVMGNTRSGDVSSYWLNCQQ